MTTIEAPTNESYVLRKDALTCQQVLSPPLQRVGEGRNCIVYEQRQPAWQCSFSRDGKWLAVCYGAPGPCIRIWKQSEVIIDVGNNKQDAFHWTLESTISGIQNRTIRSVMFAPILSPLILASASFDGTIAIWEYHNHDWDCIAQLEGHESEVKCVAWNDSGSLLATCGRDKTVWIWECFLPGTVGADNAGDFECLSVLNGHEADVKFVRFAPSHGQWGDGGEILLSASYDDSIICWAEDSGDWYCAATIKGFHSSTIWSIAVAPSGGRLVTGSADQSLAIFKCYTVSEKKARFPSENSGDTSGLWKCVGKLDNAHSSVIYSVDYAPIKAGHGRIASGGADGRIQIYREVIGYSSDQPKFVLDAAVAVNHGDVNCVCWHPLDGSLLASTADDGSISLWKYQV